MYLKRSITVNWGNLPVEEFEYGPINLFSGGNGSGKTSAADALQTLMTATHDNLFTYNPGQDETTQRGRGGKQVRTLASYVLGCDDGAYARPYACDGYIAGIFHPTQGERAEPFTAVIGVRAHLDRAGGTAQARLDELLLMIVPGTELALGHFVREVGGERHVVAIDAIADLLRQQLGKKGVEVYDNKKGLYLARLYGALRGKRDSVAQQEAKNAARTFARFMAYKPVDSIDQFVASEVLEAHEMSDTIRRIRDLLRTVHGMEHEALQLRASVELLEHSREHALAYIDTWMDRTTLTYGAAAQEFRLNHGRYLAKKAEQMRLRHEQQAQQGESEQTRQRLKHALGELVALEARMQGIPALRDKRTLEARRGDLLRELQNGIKPLLAQDQQRTRNFEALRGMRDVLARHSLDLELPLLAGQLWRSTSKALLAHEHVAVPELNHLLARDWIDLAPLEQGLERIRAEQQLHNQLAEQLHTTHEDLAGREATSCAQRLDRLVDKRTQSLDTLQQQRQQGEQRIRTLEEKRVPYPPDVDEALRAIRQRCPDADPRVLCDYVDVVDPEWQMAIEGYIGNARFGILVEAAHEAEAIRIVRSLAGRRRNSARVIQGEQARRDAEKLKLAEDSIVNVLRFTHRTAEHYLKASYGNVVRVSDAQTLRLTRRGVTIDGMGSGNYALFRCDLGDGDLVFGEAARERNLLAQRSALQELLKNLQHANEAYQAAQQLQRQVQQFKALAWVEAASGLLERQRELKEVEHALATLDLSDHRELERQQEDAREVYRQLETSLERLNRKDGELVEQLKVCERAVKDLADRGDALQQAKDDAEAALHASTRYWPEVNVPGRIEATDRRLEQAHDEIDFAAEETQLTRTLNNALQAFQKFVLQYNQQVQPADQLLLETAEDVNSAPFFGHVCHLYRQLDNLHNRLRNSVLLEKQEQLGSLRETFNTTFVSDLCNEIHQAIKDGERTLRNLNKELEDHYFGADRERFSFEWKWVPEFKEYWDFFREVIEIPNLGDGANLFEASLSKKAAEIRDRLLALLLDGDEQQALRQLERVSDYRRYRQYDILKHPENKQPISLSQYGTGSGGQLETPAYIIRAAAVTSAFRFNEGDSHLRMVIVDEAFMHMDESRSRAVIEYLTGTLGLQLIFIMPTSKAGPFLDLISNQFVFSKVPSLLPIGELKTRVLVDRQQFNVERVARLWAQHRRVVRQQVALDFMDDTQ